MIGRLYGKLLGPEYDIRLASHFSQRGEGLNSQAAYLGRPADLMGESSQIDPARAADLHPGHLSEDYSSLLQADQALQVGDPHILACSHSADHHSTGLDGLLFVGI